MLIPHQRKHLRAVIKSATDDSIIGVTAVKERAENEDVDVKDFQDYLDDIKVKAQAVLASGVWPNEVKEPYEIHAYLELNKTFRKFDGSTQ